MLLFAINVHLTTISVSFLEKLTSIGTETKCSEWGGYSNWYAWNSSGKSIFNWHNIECTSWDFGYYFKTDNRSSSCSAKCNDGYYSSDLNYIGECKSCTVTTDGTSLTSCTECSPQLKLKTKTDGNTTCTGYWGRGYYTTYSLNDDSFYGVYDSKECAACSSPCYEWSGDSTNQCLSCQRGYYLNISTGGINVGTWLAKSDQNITVTLFVSGNAESSGADGTYGRPFRHIVKALKYGNAQVASYNKGKIDIYLLNGASIFMNRDNTLYEYRSPTKDQYSYNHEILIQPAFCGQTYGQKTFGENDMDCTVSGNTLKVYYQMGNDYEFIVPPSLTIRSIIFDATDSVLFPSNSCLFQYSQWCILTNTTLTVNPDNPVPAGNCTIINSQDENCKSTNGGAFFQFLYSDTLSTISAAGTLIIDSCTFMNFFHDYTSLIGLIEGHGHVSITNSTFEQFSNWGSIIRDTRDYPRVDDLDGFIQFTSLRYSRAAIEILSDLYYIKPSSACTNSTCASITISNSTFQNFNYLKSNMKTGYLIKYNNPMKYQGLILTLSNFYGNIKINSNIFQNLRFPFSDWGLYDNTTYQDIFSLWYVEEAYQIKTLFKIDMYSNIEFSSNTFQNSNSHSGLIIIKKYDNTKGLLVHSNSFYNNSAIININLIRIDIQNDIGYDTAIGNYMPWAGVQISNNTFTNNVACLYTVGILKATWYSSTKLSEIETTSSTSYIDPDPMNMTSSQNIQKTSVISFSTVNNCTFENTTTIDLNKFMMMNNVFESNYAGHNTGLVYIHNIRAVYMQNEEYKYNSGHFLEALSTYGTIASANSLSSGSTIGGVSFAEYFLTSSGINSLDPNARNAYYSGPPITIDGALLVSIDNMQFTNNFKQEYDSETDFTVSMQSQAITFRRWNGKVNIKSMTVQDLKGLDASLITPLLGNTSTNLNQFGVTERNTATGAPTNGVTDPSYAIDYGISKPIILFQNPPTDSSTNFANYLDSVNIENLTLSNITFYDPASTTAVFANFLGKISNLNITTVSISNIDLPLNAMSIFEIQNKGTLTLGSLTVSGLETTSYRYDTSGYSYLAIVSPLLTLTSFSNDSSLSTLSYNIDNINITKSYGIKGTAMFFTDTTGVLTFHEVTVAISNLNINEVSSYSGSAVNIEWSGFAITISSSTFQNNIGVAGPADVTAKSFRGLAINDTSISGSTTNSATTTSIEFSMSSIYTYVPVMNNVTFKWEDSSLTTTEFKGLVNATTSTLTGPNPIKLTSATLKTENCTFQNWYTAQRGGVLFVGSTSVYEDDSSTFSQNAAFSGGAVYSEKGTITLTGTSFTENYANDAGAVSLTSESIMQSMTSTTFTLNYAVTQGGGLSVASSSQLSISSATFTSNEAETSNAIYALGTSETTTINSTKFQNNVASVGRAISLLFANSNLNNWTFIDNTASRETEGIFTTFSTVSVTNSNFKNSETMYGNSTASSLTVPGGFIYASVGVEITITSCIFTKGNAYSGGAIYMSGNSKIILLSSNFTDNYSYTTGGSIFLSNYESLQATSWQFESSISETSGSEIYSEVGSLTLTSCTFSVSSVTISIYLRTTTFVGSSVTMSNSNTSNTNITSEEGGWIASYDSTSFSLSDSSISNINFAQKGGAIYLESSVKTLIPTSASHSFSNVTFTNNTAYHGGALYIKEIDYVQISNVTMTQNSVINSTSLDGTGGALYYSSSSSYSQVVFSSSWTISSNTAQSSGGGMFWNYNQPSNISLITFTSNTATLYGNDYGWFAQKMTRIEESVYNSSLSLQRSLDSGLSGTDSITLSDQQSGGTIPTIYLALVDEFGQYVGSDSTSTATISIVSSTTGETYSPTLVGTTTQSASRGMFAFSSLVFTAEPGRTFSLSFSNTGIDSSKPSNSVYMTNLNTTDTSLSFSVSLRVCQIGEAFLDSGVWEKWTANISYSLTTMNSSGTWKTCQASKMYWYGGSDVGPKPGYWRSSNTTDNFISCLYSSAWLGNILPNNYTGKWFTGYQGILWSDWEVGFSRTGNYKWSQWPNPIWNVIRLTLIMLLVLFILIVIIRSTFAGASQRKNLRSVYIKILMNHLQLIILTASFDFDWPQNVLDIFETAEPAAEVSTQIFSVDWFLDSRSDDNDLNPIRLFYQKMIIYALLPILVFIGNIGFWYIYYSFKKNQVGKRAGRIAATVIILLFLIHPTIVRYMFSNFNCLDIDDDRRIYDDLEVICWNTEHMNYSLIIAVPSIVVWGFGIPFIAWVILNRNKERLDEIETREKYGFLYNGYKKQYYFWENVNMYRKISIIFVSIFLKLAGVITQALVIFLVLIFFLTLNIKLLPFAFNSLNDMEMMSLITSMLTIYCGLFYLSHMPEVYNSDDTDVQNEDNGLRLSEGSKWLFFVIILSCNVLFLVYWCYKMLKELENTMMTKFEKVYLCICLCGNKNKLKYQKRKRKIQDENEILKEQFDIQLSKISNLYREGKLVLNKINIQKSAAYLNPQTYLKNIKINEGITEKELKKNQRFRRKRKN